MFRVILKSAAFLAAFSGLASQASAVEVYMFKGAGDFSFVNENMHFSLGLNDMADTLNAEGIHTEVRRFGAIEDALATIRKRKPKTIAFVGHSMGALASMAMARNLKDEGVDIVYMALLDIPGPVGVAGENVRKVENYFTINPVYGKLTNVRSHPDAKNIHVAGYIHNHLDDAPKVKRGILKAIRDIHAREQNAVPAEAPVYVQNRQPDSQDLRALAAAPAQGLQGDAQSDAWASLRTPTYGSAAMIPATGYVETPRPLDPVTTSSVTTGPARETGLDLDARISGFLGNPERKRGADPKRKPVGR
ncbi:MAG: thioesterase domain-containing protein [Pseudomonadota bacterium]